MLSSIGARLAAVSSALLLLVTAVSCQRIESLQGDLTKANGQLAVASAQRDGAQALADERLRAATGALRLAETAGKANLRRAEAYRAAQPSNPNDLCASADALMTEALMREKQ